jgi:hypothetical protein
VAARTGLGVCFGWVYGTGAAEGSFVNGSPLGMTYARGECDALLGQPGDQVDRGRDDERPKRVGEQRVPQRRATDVGGLQIRV